MIENRRRKMRKKLKYFLFIVLIFLIILALSAKVYMPNLERTDGLSKVEILPPVGEYLPSGSERFGEAEKTRIRLLNLSAEITKLKEGIHYTRIVEKDNEASQEIIYIINPDEPVILLKGSVKNEYEKGFKKRYWVHLYAYAYDSSGREIARSQMGGAPGTPEDYGVLLSIKEGEKGNFELVIKYNESIATIKIFASIAEWPAP